MRFIGVVTSLQIALTFAACGADSPESRVDDQRAGRAIAAEDVAAQNTEGYGFDLITPTGEVLFKAALAWQTLQPLSYAQPANCGNNVSVILRSADLDDYANGAVLGILRRIQNAPDAAYFPMPRLRSDGRFLAALNAIHGGKIPAGAVVAGCSNARCDGEPGEQHVAIVGETDSDGVVWLYHNNWLRPATFGGHRPANCTEFMVSEEHLSHGSPRQWMKTPWIQVTRDATSDEVTSVKALLRPLDDLDPSQYFMKIAIVPEIEQEIAAGQGAQRASALPTAGPFTCGAR